MVQYYGVMHPRVVTKLLSMGSRSWHSKGPRHRHHADRDRRDRHGHREEQPADTETAPETLLELRDELRRLNDRLEESTPTDELHGAEIPVTSESSDADEMTAKSDDTETTEPDLAELERAIERLRADVAALEDRIDEQN